MTAVNQAAAALPPLQNTLLKALTGIGDLRPEPRATCADCAMCGSAGGSRVVFSPTVKCCSYLPTLANFLAGRALTGPGRAGVLGRIDRRSGITPLGVGLDPVQAHRVLQAQPSFGRSDEVLCPHFQAGTGGCGIWESRNAVCSTWFCKYERGEVSLRFWHAVRDLLMAAEERLGYWCLTGADLPDEQIAAVLEYRARVREAIHQGAPVAADPEAQYALTWGSWQGREEEWFSYCARKVSAITPEELAELMHGVRHLAAAVTQARELGELPDRLSFAPAEVIDDDPQQLGLVGYSAYDPLTVPSEMLAPLRLFDGRPTAEVLDEMAARHGLRLGPGVLGELRDFGVLRVLGEGGQPLQHA
jgi:hypothetical protein